MWRHSSGPIFWNKKRHSITGHWSRAVYFLVLWSWLIILWREWMMSLYGIEMKWGKSILTCTMFCIFFTAKWKPRPIGDLPFVQGSPRGRSNKNPRLFREEWQLHHCHGTPRAGQGLIWLYHWKGHFGGNGCPRILQANRPNHSFLPQGRSCSSRY